jgi:gluconate 2-dehydrogenase gamma chain
MTEINRRQTLKALAAVPAAVAFTWTAEEASVAAAQAQQARGQAAAANQPYTPRFFNAHEYATVVALSDMIIPKDARSGSASEAGAPEFIDFLIAEQADRQTAIRGGLSWLDTQCRSRFDKDFVGCSDADRRTVLEDIAWPKRAKSEHSQGVRFFTTMRDLVATGFWTSRIGVADLGYLGNRPVGEWTGAPAEILQKLGL